MDVVDQRNSDRNATNMYCICETHMLHITMTFRYPNFSIIRYIISKNDPPEFIVCLVAR